MMCSSDNMQTLSHSEMKMLFWGVFYVKCLNKALKPQFTMKFRHGLWQSTELWMKEEKKCSVEGNVFRGESFWRGAGSENEFLD